MIKIWTYYLSTMLALSCEL